MQFYVVTESGPLIGILTGAACRHCGRPWPLGSALNPAFDSYQGFVFSGLSSELRAP